MFTRSILIPSIVVCAIASPFLFKTATQPTNNPSTSMPGGYPTNYQTNYQAGYVSGGTGAIGGTGAMLPSGSPNGFPYGQPSQPVFPTGGSNFQTALSPPSGNPMLAPQRASWGTGQPNPGVNPAPGYQPGLQPIQYPQPNPQPTNNWNPNSFQFQTVGTQIQPVGTVTSPPAGIDSQFAGMNPDYGAAKTWVFAGDANGPDLTGPPLEFMPVTNLAEIFRFDVSPDWVKRRWQRVSTCPGDTGLHGLRVALVTGTNSWDLHGSQTYYFDSQQRLQRITFRGWTGDASHLVRLLTQNFEFTSQPTHWAGFYLAKKRRTPTGGLLMQNPPVIYSENPVQQVALVLEINQAQGQFSLSDDFISLIRGSQSAQ